MARTILFILVIVSCIFLIAAILFPIEHQVLAANFTNDTGSETKTVYTLLDNSSFFSGTTGKQIITSGQDATSLIIPPLLAAIYLLWLGFRFLQRKLGNGLLRLSFVVSVISLISLALWWNSWTAFQIPPAIGFWIMGVAAIVLLLIGILSVLTLPMAI